MNEQMDKVGAEWQRDSKGIGHNAYKTHVPAHEYPVTFPCIAGFKRLFSLFCLFEFELVCKAQRSVSLNAFQPGLCQLST